MAIVTVPVMMRFSLEMPRRRYRTMADVNRTAPNTPPMALIGTSALVAIMSEAEVYPATGSLSRGSGRHFVLGMMALVMTRSRYFSISANIDSTSVSDR
jgi:hypothetical protein